MSRKVNPVVIAGAVLALVGVVLLAILAGRGPGAGKTTRVVVASAPVAAGTAASQAGLVVKSVAVSAVPTGAITDPSAVAGQVTLHALAAGEIILPSAFGLQGAAEQGGVLLPAGKEGLGVELGFAPGGLRYVLPGNSITIWATVKGHGTQVLLAGIDVIATTPGTGTGQGTAVTPGPGTLDFLLAVSRPQAAAIIDAQTSGATLYFTLEPTGQKG